jgi:hypothetical protein
VCHKEDSRSAVRRSDSRSFKIPNPDGVAETLQVLANVISGNGQDPRYVFSNDPMRSNFSDQPRKFRPQVSIVVPSGLLTSHGEGLLAWKSAENNVNCSPIPNHLLYHFTGQVVYVLKKWDSRPVFVKDTPAKWIAFAHRRHVAACRLEGQIKAADSAK